MVRGSKKGPWTSEEDSLLSSYIKKYGIGCWRSLPAKAGLNRCGKSCRLRWTNYLRPDISRGNFSLREEQTIVQLHALLGNKWSTISHYLPKRTDNDIKNHWNTKLKKRLQYMGFDPNTHKPISPSSSPKLTHIAQWETARLQAEVRLVRQLNPLIAPQVSHNFPNPPKISFNFHNLNDIYRARVQIPMNQPGSAGDIVVPSNHTFMHQMEKTSLNPIDVIDYMLNGPNDNGNLIMDSFGTGNGNNEYKYVFNTEPTAEDRNADDDVNFVEDNASYCNSLLSLVDAAAFLDRN